MSLLDAQRGRAADQIAAVGDALRRSAESLDSKGGASLVRYANRTADQISGFAGTIRDRSLNDLGSDIESFARRWPMLFMASAVGIGFIAGRFMLSSADRTRGMGTHGTGTSGAHTQPGAMRHDTRTETRAVPTTGARPGYGSPAAGE
jgi:hypothetical protein